MLPCPYCRTPLAENTSSCPSCEFDLARAKAVMGPIPRLEPSGFTDFTCQLSKSEIRRIEKARAKFKRQFPQLEVQIIISRMRTDFPVPVTFFWLFNLGGFCAENRKYGKNRDIMIAVDPHQSRVGITTGYGLEPFLNNNTIDGFLADSALFFQTGDVAAGLVKLLESISAHLAELSKEVPATLGLSSPTPKPSLVSLPDY